MSTGCYFGTATGPGNGEKMPKGITVWFTIKFACRSTHRPVGPQHATESKDCTRRVGPVHAIDMGFVASAHYPGRKKAEYRLPETRSRVHKTREDMSCPSHWRHLIFTCLFTETAFAQPPVRKFDDPGSPH